MEYATAVRPERPSSADCLPAGHEARRVLHDRVTARLRGPRAHEQVARSLADVVAEAFLIRGRIALPHLQDALDEPIAAATEVALETLVDELADLVDLLPMVEPDAWERARLEADLGLE